MDRCRAWLKDLGFAFSFCVLAVTGVSAHPSEEPDTEPAPINLAEDEAYRRQGILADVKTCLAVADDARAAGLLNHENIEAAFLQPPVQRAKALRDVGSVIKTNSGYGTLLACSEIVSAWYSRTLMVSKLGKLSAANQSLPENDGRFEHGAFVIDLAITRTERAEIAPVPLARLLASPGILPPSAYGGIVVKNAVIPNPLILHNLSVARPIAFVNVRFSGGTINQALYDLDKRTAATAVVISSASFENQLIFADSEVCGSVAIREAHFKESLTFRDVEQFDIGCLHRPDAGSDIALDIDGSRFDQNLTITQSRFAEVTIAGNTAEKIATNRVDFGRNLLIEENVLGGLQLDCSIFADRTKIVRNRVDLAMSLEGTAFKRVSGRLDHDCRHWWDQPPWDHVKRSARINVENNRIDGGLIFRDFTGNEITSPIILKYNTVRGRSQIVLPAPLSYIKRWSGDVNLQGSRYEGTLELRRSPWRSFVPAESGRVDGYCAEISKTNKLKGVAFELRATHARVLRWDLPLTCDYRWLGYGLTYDLWMKGQHAVKSLGDIQEEHAIRADYIAFEAWRKTLRLYEPSSLTTVSDYLAEKGEYVESRDVLLEVKRLNYTPTCPPDQWTIGCAFTIGGELLASIVEAFSAPQSLASDRGTVTKAAIGEFSGYIGDRFWSVLDWFWRLAMLILLWPGGYGAQPERAFLLLFGAFGLCWFFYARYTKRMREQLLHEWTAIDGFFSGNADRIARTISSTQSLHDLAEEHTDFTFEDTVGPGNGCPLRISEKIWMQQMSHEERLSAVQGPLLDRIKALEKAALESDVKVFRDFRERLERFGNTEIVGFGRFDVNKMPKRFTAQIYSFDTMLPVIDLHAYGNYYPINGRMRAMSIIQHVCGWWWITVFIASAAIL